MQKSFWLWAMLSGLVVGFLVGRYAVPQHQREREAQLAAVQEAVAPRRPSPPAAAAPPAAPPPAAPVAGAKRVTLAAHHPRKGPAKAKVTLVEFSDFQCPYCSRVLPLVDELTKAYPKDLAFVFVNLPLRSMHPLAADAAKAFLAAHRQGPAKGWKMHDQLFANQQALALPDLERHAQGAGLDVPRWKKDMSDPQLEKELAVDEALANRLAVPGTPTFYMNGREVSGGLDRAMIDQEIARADALLAKGVKLDQLYQRFLEEADKPIAIEVGAAPSKGPSSAPVTIVAFSEFQCPYCSRAVPGLKEVEKAYGGKVRIAFKHLLIPGHQQAPLAAEASLAAHAQGKFWPYHDKLFENQQALDRASLERYAKEVDLDLARFKRDLDSGKHRQQVEADQRQAALLGASATPTFFVNGRKSMGAKDFPQWKALIDEVLAAGG